MKCSTTPAMSFKVRKIVKCLETFLVIASLLTLSSKLFLISLLKTPLSIFREADVRILMFLKRSQILSLTSGMCSSNGLSQWSHAAY